MEEMTSVEIRDKFLEFFREHEHLIIDKSSIIPKNDPTLLFINSGMAPLKRLFTGEETPECPRLCNIQPCIRTIDIDEVGDKHHLTSFQMLGSWSIGDYFKEKAIPLAFKFLTEYLNIPKEKLYVTIFSGDPELGLEEDAEAREHWKSCGVDESHVVACGREDNFWGPTSETGPCGPCTEVFYDTGEGEDHKYIPGGYFDTKIRYIEIWNAGVFMQFNKNSDGTYNKLQFKSVDTGAGLERLAMALNGAASVYDTDLLRPIKECIKSGISGKCDLPERDMLIMTDHMRTLALILSEKVKPSNEGRGYIPRKLIRKCLLLISKRKIQGFNLLTVLKFILDTYSGMFEGFVKNREYIIEIFRKECEQFETVLRSGLVRLEAIKESGEEIGAECAFELVTTYGLPVDIIREFAAENGIKLDEQGYEERLKEHKSISRKTGKGDVVLDQINAKTVKGYEKTKFVGYESLQVKSRILGLFMGGEEIITAKSGDEVTLVVDTTSFYAQSGGQSADTGTIYNDNFKVSVSNVQKVNDGIILHVGKVESGAIDVNNMDVILQVDAHKRAKTANNHTAAHLLHSALKEIFGNDVNQAGSNVEEDKLRFDFNYDEKITNDDIARLEKLVNAHIRRNMNCNIQHMELADAVKQGATALFDSKYGEKVRVITFEGVSKELCAGTHAKCTGDIGLFVILSAEGIGKGIKRITAITGEEALIHVQAESLLIRDISALLKVKSHEIASKLAEILEKEKKNFNSESEEKFLLPDADVKATKNGIKYAIIQSNEFKKSARDKIIEFSDKIGGVVLYAAGGEIKQTMVCSAKIIENKCPAGNVLKSMIEKVGGRGGGNNRTASAGGVNGSAADIVSAFTEVLEGV